MLWLDSQILCHFGSTLAKFFFSFLEILLGEPYCYGLCPNSCHPQMAMDLL